VAIICHPNIARFSSCEGNYEENPGAYAAFSWLGGGFQPV
jgi:hypothetical protein